MSEQLRFSKVEIYYRGKKYWGYKKLKVPYIALIEQVDGHLYERNFKIPISVRHKFIHGELVEIDSECGWARVDDGVILIYDDYGKEHPISCSDFYVIDSIQEWCELGNMPQVTPPELQV